MCTFAGSEVQADVTAPAHLIRRNTLRTWGWACFMLQYRALSTCHSVPGSSHHPMELTGPSPWDPASNPLLLPGPVPSGAPPSMCPPEPYSGQEGTPPVSSSSMSLWPLLTAACTDQCLAHGCLGERLGWWGPDHGVAVAMGTSLQSLHGLGLGEHRVGTCAMNRPG